MEPGDQAQRVPCPQKQTNKKTAIGNARESFMASTAKPRTVQLCGGGASAITKALDSYGGTLPLLMQPAVGKATRHIRESPPLQRWATITMAALTTPI